MYVIRSQWMWRTRKNQCLHQRKKHKLFFRHCGLLENAHFKLQSVCKPSLFFPEEKLFQMEPSAVTNLWTYLTWISSFRSLWASLDTERCKKKCFLHCTWKEWSYLELLAENTREDLRFTPGLLELGTEDLNPLYSNWGDTGSLQKGLSCFRSDWNWSTATPDAPSAGLVV